MIEGLSLFVPVRNEEALLARNIPRLLAEAERLTPNVQLVVVENGSTDRTPIIIDELAAADARIVPLKLVDPGVGSAMRAAVPRFAFPYVLAIDADLTIDLSFLEEAARRLGDGADIVIGSKRMGVQQRGRFRVLTSEIFTWLLRHALGLPFDDVSIGAKGYRREVLQRYFACIGADSVYVLDVIARAHVDGLRIEQFAVFCYDSRRSQFNLPREGVVRFGHLFLRIAARMLRGGAAPATTADTAPESFRSTR